MVRVEWQNLSFHFGCLVLIVVLVRVAEMREFESSVGVNSCCSIDFCYGFLAHVYAFMQASSSMLSFVQIRTRVWFLVLFVVGCSSVNSANFINDKGGVHS